MSLDKKLSKADVTITEEKTVYSGFFKIKKFLLKHTLFRGGLSNEISRELFCRGTSVGVLLYDPKLILSVWPNNFASAALKMKVVPWVWEVIAGVNDKNETPEQVAVREVKEESGVTITPASLVPICNYYSSPGGTDERLQLYCAITPLIETENSFGVEDEAEDILFKTLAYPQVISAMLDGTINNAATIIALQWLQLNRQSLREKCC